MRRFRYPKSLISDAEQEYAKAVREFAAGEIAPKSREMERAGQIPASLIEKLADFGLFAAAVPEEFGGAGFDFFHLVLAVEELARADASVALLVDVHGTLVVKAVESFGTGEQRAELLPQLAGGRLGAFSLSEAEAGSDAFALKASATEAEGGYLLQGAKSWVSGGREAGLFLVFARAPEGVTGFLVDASNPGLRLGAPEEKVGLKASSTMPLYLDNCFVPRERILGRIGQGRRIALSLLNEGRIGIAAQLVGVGQAALDLALAHAETRRAFGKPIFGFQGVSFALADAATRLESARVLTWNAARLVDEGGDPHRTAAMAKLTAQRTAEKVTSLAIELMGGIGYTADSLAEKLWRDAKAGTIYEGTANMQLMTIAHTLRRG